MTKPEVLTIDGRRYLLRDGILHPLRVPHPTRLDYARLISLVVLLLVVLGIIAYVATR